MVTKYELKISLENITQYYHNKGDACYVDGLHLFILWRGLDRFLDMTF